MASIHWLDPVNGNLNVASDWSGGSIPDPADDAILDAPGGAFTVTAPTSETVESIQLAANATLAITGGTFTAAAGTGLGANAGKITIGSRSRLLVSGELDNS